VGKIVVGGKVTRQGVAVALVRFLNSVMATPDEIQEKTFCKWSVFDLFRNIIVGF